MHKDSRKERDKLIKCRQANDGFPSVRGASTALAHVYWSDLSSPLISIYLHFLPSSSLAASSAWERNEFTPPCIFPSGRQERLGTLQAQWRLLKFWRLRAVGRFPLSLLCALNLTLDTPLLSLHPNGSVLLSRFGPPFSSLAPYLASLFCFPLKIIHILIYARPPPRPLTIPL